MKELGEGNRRGMERWLKGEITATELFELNEDAARALAEHGYLLYEQGKYATAKIIFEALAATNSNNPDYHRMLASIYQLQEKWDASYYHYSLVLRSTPDDAYVLANRGEVLLRLDRAREAAEDLKQAVLLDPQNNHPAGRRARILLSNIGVR